MCDNPNNKCRNGIVEICMIIFAACIISAVVIIGYRADYEAEKEMEINQSYSKGYNSGVDDILNYISMESSRCNSIAINSSGIITELINVRCING